MLLFSAREANSNLKMEERPHHPLVLIDNCVKLEDSLTGMPLLCDDTSSSREHLNPKINFKERTDRDLITAFRTLKS